MTSLNSSVLCKQDSMDVFFQIMTSLTFEYGKCCHLYIGKPPLFSSVVFKGNLCRNLWRKIAYVFTTHVIVNKDSMFFYFPRLV